MHTDSIRAARLDRNLLAGRNRTNGADHVFQHRGDLKIRLGDPVLPRFNVRYVQERLNQLIQPVAFIDDGAEKHLPFLVDQIVLQKHVAVSADGKPLSSMGVDFRDVTNTGRPAIWYTALEKESFPLLLYGGDMLFDDTTARSGVGWATMKMSGSTLMAVAKVSRSGQAASAPGSRRCMRCLSRRAVSSSAR